jgi:hypothetical protein
MSDTPILDPIEDEPDEDDEPDPQPEAAPGQRMTRCIARLRLHNHAARAA